MMPSYYIRIWAKNLVIDMNRLYYFCDLHDHALSNIRILHIFRTVGGDESLAGREIVAQKGIEHDSGQLCIGGCDGDETA